MDPLNRRKFLVTAARAAGCLALGGLTYKLLGQAQGADGRWVIDVDACQACGLCATHCVREKSAVICRNRYEDCGLCVYCYGYEIRDEDAFSDTNQGDNNLVCKQKALLRRPIHIYNEAEGIDEYRYEYSVDEDLCNGCGACVKRCRQHGNNTLYLTVREDLCKDCNSCSIERVCEGKRPDGKRAIFVTPFDLGGALALRSIEDSLDASSSSNPSGTWTTPGENPHEGLDGDLDEGLDADASADADSAADEGSSPDDDVPWGDPAEETAPSPSEEVPWGNPTEKTSSPPSQGIPWGDPS